MPIVIIIILITFGLIYMFYPLLNKSKEIKTHWDIIEDKLVNLEDHKSSLFATLKDLELDFSTDKISKEDFDHSWNTYKNNAINAIKEIDKLKIQKNTKGKNG